MSLSVFTGSVLCFDSFCALRINVGIWILQEFNKRERGFPLRHIDSAQQKDTDYSQKWKLNMREVQYLAWCCRVSVSVEPSLHTLLRAQAFPYSKSNSLS